jgi:hypothetical protein
MKYSACLVEMFSKKVPFVYACKALSLVKDNKDWKDIKNLENHAHDFNIINRFQETNYE